MFKNLSDSAVKPRRVVILGGQGFVGGAIAKRLQQDNILVLSLGRQQLDLLQSDSADQLARLLHPDDTLFIVSAKAPCKDYAMLADNITMIQNVCDALSRQVVSHVIYISSDAVYADSVSALTEDSLKAPDSLHGVMHLARELMLASVVQSRSFLCLRPSLIYGERDPHNGYGPNRFYRLAKKGESITLFGEGEERRDHVFIDDVAEIARLSVLYKRIGSLNLATGETISFHRIAMEIIRLFGEKSMLKTQLRQGSMPHNGCRTFDITRCQSAWPNFRYHSFSEGLLKMHVRLMDETKELHYAGN